MPGKLTYGIKTAAYNTKSLEHSLLQLDLSLVLAFYDIVNHEDPTLRNPLPDTMGRTS